LPDQGAFVVSSEEELSSRVENQDVVTDDQINFL